MKRAQFQMDEGMYQKLRRRAYESGRSVSSIVRELIASGLEKPRTKKKRSIRQFGFIGCGASDQGMLSPVSERHDEALAEVIASESRKKR